MDINESIRNEAVAHAIKAHSEDIEIDILVLAGQIEQFLIGKQTGEDKDGSTTEVHQTINVEPSLSYDLMVKEIKRFKTENANLRRSLDAERDRSSRLGQVNSEIRNTNRQLAEQIDTLVNQRDADQTEATEPLCLACFIAKDLLGVEIPGGCSEASKGDEADAQGSAKSQSKTDAPNVPDFSALIDRFTNTLITAVQSARGDQKGSPTAE